jgi:hypothetical protein
VSRFLFLPPCAHGPVNPTPTVAAMGDAARAVGGATAAGDLLEKEIVG